MNPQTPEPRCPPLTGKHAPRMMTSGMTPQPRDFVIPPQPRGLVMPPPPRGPFMPPQLRGLVMPPPPRGPIMPPPPRDPLMPPQPQGPVMPRPPRIITPQAMLTLAPQIHAFQTHAAQIHAVQMEKAQMKRDKRQEAWTQKAREQLTLGQRSYFAKNAAEVDRFACGCNPDHTGENHGRRCPFYPPERREICLECSVPLRMGRHRRGCKKT
ncbi:hypothetical protein K402DRAFT_397184 [Aulographum hederae CBS 113979]|uniref:Uncharacterized protein n=1 Tax=Aulographum hederae CBS 113979 TaxID=1176131 RepID=A0A6G1GQ04_9PEZI|nr:hypothetical protein K402DRAFT_397184 [Aulographum hederae CBS 113979]